MEAGATGVGPTAHIGSVSLGPRSSSLLVMRSVEEQIKSATGKWEPLAPPIPSLAVTKIMVDMLEPKPTDILMEIGTGTGSQTVIWQKYFKEVHSVELNEKWHIAENQPLGPHVYLSWGDGSKGLPDAAPFDAIVCTCGLPDIPEAWKDQLADGGRLVAPVGTNQGQKLTLFRKLGGHLIPVRIGAYTRFVMMEKEHGRK